MFSNGSFGVLIKYPSDSVTNLPKKLGIFCILVKIAKKFSDKLTKNLAVWTGLRMKLSFLICWLKITIHNFTLFVFKNVWLTDHCVYNKVWWIWSLLELVDGYHKLPGICFNSRKHHYCGRFFLQNDKSKLPRFVACLPF